MLYLVHKPLWITSNLVVKILKRVINVKKIGFAGTLDPLASGLMIVGTEGSPRLFPLIEHFQKTYKTTIRLDGTTWKNFTGTCLVRNNQGMDTAQWYILYSIFTRRALPRYFCYTAFRRRKSASQNRQYAHSIRGRKWELFCAIWRNYLRISGGKKWRTISSKKLCLIAKTSFFNQISSENIYFSTLSARTFIIASTNLVAQ